MEISQDLDKIATSYHLSEEQSDIFIENMCQDYEINWIESKIRNESESSIIDFGYGDGRFLTYLSRFKRAKIVEGSNLLVEKAHQIISQNNWKIQMELSFFENIVDSNNYDFVLASHVLEHVDNPQTVLAKARELLKDKGKMIVVVPNQESIHRRIGLNLGMIERLDSLSNRDLLVGHQRVYSLKQLICEVKEAGFEVIEYRGFFLKPLSNDKLVSLSKTTIQALLEISDDLPPEQCANIGLICQKVK
jgi:2-polyprenyl-3-methyl-5-hydroxy-6-metoxy-1,4-benzoquinol methylase